MAIQNSKCQDLTKFSFLGVGVFLATQNLKCQVLTKFSFSEGGFLAPQNSNYQVLTKFSFSEGGILGLSKLKVPSPNQIFMGGGVFLATQNLKCQVMTNHFWGGREGGGGGILGKMSQKFSKPKLATASQIVSHTTHVETNQTVKNFTLVTRFLAIHGNIILREVISTRYAKYGIQPT